MLVLAAVFAMQVSTREIKFNGAGGFELEGTLLLPANAKNAPALLLLPGSGPTDRNGSVLQMGLKVEILKEIAGALAKEGVATFRFDKRAVHFYAHKWPKDMKQIGTFFSWSNHIADATAALESLRCQPEIDASRVGVLGHSEGSLIGIKMASVPENKIHGLVMLAGPGRPLDAVVMQQLQEKLPEQVPAAQVPVYLDYSKRAIAQIKVNATIPPNPPAGLEGLFNPSALVFLQENMKDDPSKLALLYTGDTLVMNGEFDNQVSPEKDAKALYAAFKKRTLGNAQLKIVPKASHAFKPTSNRGTDAMTGPMIPAALDGIVKWCKEHLVRDA
jgi:uncharacterized protein